MSLVNSDLMKSLSTVFLFMVAVTTLGLCVFDIVIGKPIPDIVGTALYTSITAAAAITGVHYGTSAAASTASTTATVVGKATENGATIARNGNSNGGSHT